MIIYKITNKLSGKCYIGQTVQPLNYRWRVHCRRKEGCSAIAEAIHKYGKDAFTIEEIDSYSNLEDLNNAEEFYIDWFNSIVPNGYNLDSGGNNKRHSEQTITKMRESAKGRTLSKEHREKLSKAHMNKVPSLETRKKMSEAHKGKNNHFYGKKHTDETKRRISLTKSGVKNG